LGVPSDEWGEVVTAVVVADGPVDEQSLLAHAARALAPHKRPRAVRFVAELPRTALGKVLLARSCVARSCVTEVLREK